MGNEGSKTFRRDNALQIIFICAAFAIALLGLFRNTNLSRMIIYCGQCIACVLLFIFGILKYNDIDRKYLKMILLAYALFEALRSSLLITTGVNTLIGVIAKFILAVLACNCVLVAERIDHESCFKMALGLIALEIALYLVFLIGFPGVMLGHMNRFMPLVGVLIAACIALIAKGNNVSSDTDE